MKSLVLLVFSIIFGFASVALFFIVHKQVEVRQIPLPKPSISFSLENPPPKSIRGNVVSITGDVVWESRIATEASTLTKNIPLVQGEFIETKDNGIVSVQFPKASFITLAPKSKIYFVQAIPKNLVIVQESGSVQYEQTGSIPISVRTLGLLVSQDTGEIHISINALGSKVTVTADTGNVTLAYEDKDNLSILENLEERDRFVFYPDEREGEVIGQ